MDNSTRCSQCGNHGNYSVAQYTTTPNGSKIQNGWKSFECKNCKLMLEGLHLIKVIQNRLTIIEDIKVKNELEKLLECLPSLKHDKSQLQDSVK